MLFSEDTLRYDERAIMELRTLYRQYGYTQYRMNKFEEYGLYADNKSFLVSDNVITFTDAGGKLMALRPDVTLSIVKNTKDGAAAQKLYYNENVYRPGGMSHEFKERMQVGLECIGELDVYLMSEVIMLAAMSLRALSGRTCLDISHMGYISGFLDSEELSPGQRAEILGLVGGKNVPELRKFCAANGLGFSDGLCGLTELYGPYGEMLGELRRLSVNSKTEAALNELSDIYGVLELLGVTDGLNLDFSVVNDMNYYSGIIFQGYIDGIPAEVLSGGRYDKLMRKFGKRSGAIGFAVYLDLLERLSPPRGGPEVDVLLIYGGGADAEDAARAVSKLTAEGLSVRVLRELPGDIKYGRLIRLAEGEGF